MNPDFDRFGAYTGAFRDGKIFLDLTKLNAKFIPAPFPVGTHDYTPDFCQIAGEVHTAPYLIKTHKVNSLEETINLLAASKGLHYLMYVELRDSYFLVRKATFAPDSEQARGTLTLPKTIDEWLSLWGTSATDLSKYPAKCPRCNADAYVGWNTVDCSAKCGV